MSSMGTKAAIIEHLLEHCQRSTELPLGFLEHGGDVYDSPSEPAEVVSALTERFLIESLLASDIVVAKECETVALTPLLTECSSFIVLRDAATQQPFEILTSAGCLAADALPIFEVLRDSRTRQLVERGTGDLFVAFDLEHVVMLRACGLPATLAVGLDGLPLEQVDHFCELFELGCFKSDRAFSREQFGAEVGDQSECGPDDPIRRIVRSMMNEDAPSETHVPPATFHGPTAEPIKARLVILAWTPLNLTDAMPLQLKTVVDHLHQLQRFLGLDLQNIGVWEVEEETIERLRFIAERRSTAIFKAALFDAAEDIGASVVQFGEEKPLAIGPPDDYTTALARLLEYASSEVGTRLPAPSQRNEAWRDFQTLLSQQVIGPLRELALATSNPVERNLLMGFAELSNVFHMQSVAMSEQLCRRTGDRSGQLPEDQLENVMAMADRFIGMARVTERCRTTIIGSRTIDSPSFPRLPNSG